MVGRQQRLHCARNLYVGQLAQEQSLTWEVSGSKQGSHGGHRPAYDCWKKHQIANNANGRERRYFLSSLQKLSNFIDGDKHYL